MDISGRSTGSSARAVLRAISGRGPSTRRQNPAAQSVVTLRAASVLANSSAVQPPSEMPATWARSMPTPASVSRTANAMLVGLARTSSGRSGESPKPGMSTAITSNSSDSSGMTGRQTPRWAPSGWIRTSAGPEPLRSYASSVIAK